MMRILITSPDFQDGGGSEDLCLGQPILHPHTRQDITSFNMDLFKNPRFRELVAQRLSGAVKIPSVTYDGMGKIGADPRWNIFYSFTKYLQEVFPTL
jgi:Gly-Xaa carboxypeptidase